MHKAKHYERLLSSDPWKSLLNAMQLLTVKKKGNTGFRNRYHCAKIQALNPKNSTRSSFISYLRQLIGAVTENICITYRE